MNKRIIIVTRNYVVGGIERSAVVLANALVAKGYQVTYLVVEKIYPNTFYEIDSRINFVLLSKTLEAKSFERELGIAQKYAKRHLAINKKIRKIIKIFKLKNERVDRSIKAYRTNEFINLRAFFYYNKNAIVISFDILLHERIHIATKGMKCKYINSVIDNKSDDVMTELKMSRLYSPDMLICETYDQKNKYEQYLGFKGIVIRNALVGKLPEPFKGTRQKKIVNFCRTHPVKNLPLLINAFKIVHDHYPDYQLYIYGSTTTELARKTKEKLNYQIHDLGLSSSAFVLDATNEIHSIIVDYSMFVMSSDSEGLSNSLIEAMALGLPCISTDCPGGGPREMIKSGVNGVLVPVNHPEEMANAMCKFIENPSFAEKCGREASLVRKELSIDVIASQWIDVIESLR